MTNLDDIYDQLLVLRIQDGDHLALTELVDRWQPRLVRQAMRLVEQAAEAEEVVQSAWLAIVRGIVRLHDPACFRRWAYRIVTNKCADWVRARQQQRVRSGELTEEPAERPHGGDSQDDIALLRQSLRQLSSQRRAILTLFYLEGMSLEEVAQVLSLPVGTVKSRLHYARKELKQILERRNS